MTYPDDFDGGAPDLLEGAAPERGWSSWSRRQRALTVQVIGPRPGGVAMIESRSARRMLTTAVFGCAALLGACSSGGSTSPPVPSATPTRSAVVSAAPSPTTSSSAPGVDRSVATYAPGAIAFDRAGHLLTADCFAGYVLRLSPTGPATVYAGNGVSSVMGSIPADGTPRTEVELDCPASLALDPAGRVLIAAHADNRIVAINPDEGVVTVVGGGPPGTATDDGDLGGDGGPALKATLQEPIELAVDSHGNLYIADRDNHAVRKVDMHGVITTVAGTGDPGFSGDGGPATKARLYRPQGIAVTKDGSLYIADGDNAFIRKVDRNGTITTIAGKGTHHPIDPEELLIDSAGHVLVSDTSSVRRLSPSGTLTTLAGAPNPDATGSEPCAGIGGQATKAVITPTGLAIGPGGDLYIATKTCGVLRLASNGTLREYVPAP